jgi:hypothetical protein
MTCATLAVLLCGSERDAWLIMLTAEDCLLTPPIAVCDWV